jgi:hypothetical protein
VVSPRPLLIRRQDHDAAPEKRLSAGSPKPVSTRADIGGPA